MYLIAAATEMELSPARKALGSSRKIDFLHLGVGPVNAAYSLTRYLAANTTNINGVIVFGVAGAYLDTGLNLLDICLAEKEVLADLGICLAEAVDPFEEETLHIQREFDLQGSLFWKACSFFDSNNILFHKGCFATVNCVSGTTGRGNNLRLTHDAICENMEGAAVARVCQGFNINCLELRSISNLVEDRDPSTWQLSEACEVAGVYTAQLARYLISQP